MARPPKSAGSVRLELDAESKQRLDRCKRLSESASQTETIRRALRLYEHVLDAGGEFTIGDTKVRIL